MREILVLLPTPPKDEVVPFEREDMLKTLLFDVVSLSHSDVELMYIKQHPHHSTYMEQLDEYIIGNPPRCILVVGKAACDMVMDKPFSILRGEVSEFKGIKCIVTSHPFMAKSNPNVLDMIAEDINKAMTIAFGVEEFEGDTQVVDVSTIEQVELLAEYIKKVGGFSFDFETTELDIFSPTFFPTCLSISFQPGSAYVIPLYHFENTLECFVKDGRVTDELIRALSMVFLDRNIWKVAHNFKFDGNILKHFFGIWPMGVLYDTMTMHHQLHNNEKHGLKRIVEMYFPYMKGYEDEVGTYAWNAVPWEVLKKYGGTDADMTIRLKSILEHELLQDIPSYLSYRNILSAALVPLMETEYYGSPISGEVLLEGIRQAELRIQDIKQEMLNHPRVMRYERATRKWVQEEAIRKLDEKITAPDTTPRVKTNAERKKLQIISGEISMYDGINFDSPVQMKALLFSSDAGFRFRMPSGYKDEDTTSKDVLKLLNDTSGFVDMLLNYRGLQKLNSTYLKGIHDRLDANSRVHGKFLQHGTSTFRMSSRDPNMQNMITRTKYKSIEDLVGYVKGSFVPEAGCTLIQVDFSQAELRIIAHFADEETMLQAYRDGKDLHELTAANTLQMDVERFKQLPKEEYKDNRYKAKAQNFGWIYGQSAGGFVNYAKAQYDIDLTPEQADLWRRRFFKKYPKLLSYHRTYKAMAERDGYVRTLFGSKVHIPDIYSPVGVKRSHAERNAINSPIQGTSGQMTEFGIALLYRRLNPQVRLLNSVHDSALYNSPNSLVKESIRVIKSTLENLPLEQYFGVRFDKIPMKVDVEISTKSWKDMQPVTEI